MSNLENWNQKLRDSRKNTNFRDFLLEIWSNIPVSLNRENWMLSRIPKTDRVWKVVSVSEFNEIKAELTKLWRDFDSNKSFFENYSDLLKSISYPARITDLNVENWEFADSVLMSKNVYLSYIIIEWCENILYTFYSQDYCKNVLNSVMVWDHCDIVFSSVAILQSFKVFYSKFITNWNNIWFSTNLIWCSECIFCDNLENKKYHINNKEYSKEEYLEKKKEILKDKSRFEEYFSKLNKKSENFGSVNVNWQFCINSNDVENGHFTYRLTNWRNVLFVWDKWWRRNVLDTICSDQAWEWDIYACCNLWTAQNAYFSDSVIWTNIYYSNFCFDCSNLFGCFGLQNKQYCILNKQYEKDEWYKKVDEILSSMEKDWTFWKFLSPEYNPFYLNDTLAWIIWGFTKKDSEEKGYLWRDAPYKVDIPEWTTVISTDEISKYELYDADWNFALDTEIMKIVIKDENWDFYRIIPMEFDFHKKYSLPFSRFHPTKRMKNNFWL